MQLDIPLGKAYELKDVQFKKTGTNELMIAAFIKDILPGERKDQFKLGMMSIKTKTSEASQEVLSKNIKLLDNDLLSSMDAVKKDGSLKDLKFNIGYLLSKDADLFIVGQIYTRRATGFGEIDDPIPGRHSPGANSTTYFLEYKDILITKVNNNNEITWSRNLPFRSTFKSKFGMRPGNQPFFTQYIAELTDNNLYIFYNENEENHAIYEQPDYEPRKLKELTFNDAKMLNEDYKEIQGSNFVYNKLSLATGAMDRNILFANSEFSYVPNLSRNYPFAIPNTASDNFIKGDGGQVFIYTVKKGSGRFVELTLK